MGLEKGIEHKKEYRKPYYGAKAVDSSCRNHGSCPACTSSRLYKTKKKVLTKREICDIISEE